MDTFVTLHMSSFFRWSKSRSVHLHLLTHQITHFHFYRLSTTHLTATHQFSAHLLVFLGIWNLLLFYPSPYCLTATSAIPTRVDVKLHRWTLDSWFMTIHSELTKVWGFLPSLRSSRPRRTSKSCPHRQEWFRCHCVWLPVPGFDIEILVTWMHPEPLGN